MAAGIPLRGSAQVCV